MHSGLRKKLSFALVVAAAFGCSDGAAGVAPTAGAEATLPGSPVQEAGSSAGAAGGANAGPGPAAAGHGGSEPGSSGGQAGALSAGAGAAPAVGDPASPASDGGGVPAEPQDDAAAAPQADAGAADGGGIPSADPMVPVDIPAPVAEPVVWGFGLGVTDVAAAVKFYTEVMKMTVVKEVQREDRSETILYANEAQRGARLILMKFNDGRMTRNITAKIVWQANNASEINRAAMSHPDYVSRLNVGALVMFDGPETYIQELGGSFDDTEGASGIDVPYLIALGFSVSDLPASRAFYMTGLGMDESPLGSFSVTDATGTGSFSEFTERYTPGPGLVVQAWTPERNSKDNPVKVVLFVPDAQALADKLVAAGGTIVEPAARTPVYDNRLLIVAKDLDGYELELVQ